MKKYFAILLMAIMGLFVVSCDNRDEVIDNTAKNVVYDLNNINFTSANNFSYYQAFNRAMLASDFVLMYRKKNPVSGGTTVWEPIPKTIYFENGNEIDYDFDFTVNDITITAGSNYDIATTPDYALGQTFRVVLVPAEYGKSSVSAGQLSYDEVIRKYNIDDSKVVTLK